MLVECVEVWVGRGRGWGQGLEVGRGRGWGQGLEVGMGGGRGRIPYMNNFVEFSLHVLSPAKH